MIASELMISQFTGYFIMEVGMEKIKTVKRVRIEKWYYELHRLSVSSNHQIVCSLVMLIIVLFFCCLVLIVLRPTVSAGENFTKYVLQAESVYWLLKTLLLLAIVTMVPSMFIILFLDIAIYWKLVQLKKGKVVLINGDGIKLTLQESCSLETCEWAMELMFPEPQKFSGITCEFVSKRMVFLLNETDLNISDFLSMEFLLTFVWFGWLIVPISQRIKIKSIWT